jgi:radical SAM-linked protein
MGSNKNSMPMRIRAIFAKTEPMRFTSHLDLYRAWERMLRRAGLSLVFSQGYNPRPKLQLAAPLPLGITSCTEIIDFWLSDVHDDLNQLKTNLVAAQPPGIEIKTVESVELASPPLQKHVVAAAYEVTLQDRIVMLDQKIEQLLAAESLIRQRRDKSYDLRPLVKELSIINGEPQSLYMLLNSKEGSTGRPEEVLMALDIQPETTRIERTDFRIQEF